MNPYINVRLYPPAALLDLDADYSLSLLSVQAVLLINREVLTTFYAVAFVAC